MLTHVLSTGPGMHQLTLSVEKKGVLVARCVARVRRLGGSDRELERPPFLGLRPQEASSPTREQGGASSGLPTSFFQFLHVYDIWPFLKGHC